MFITRWWTELRLFASLYRILRVQIMASSILCVCVFVIEKHSHNSGLIVKKNIVVFVVVVCLFGKLFRNLNWGVQHTKHAMTGLKRKG